MDADPSQRDDRVTRVTAADLQSAARIAGDAARLGAVSVAVSRDRHPPGCLVTVRWPSSRLQVTFEAWWSGVQAGPAAHWDV